MHPIARQVGLLVAAKLVLAHCPAGQRAIVRSLKAGGTSRSKLAKLNTRINAMREGKWFVWCWSRTAGELPFFVGMSKSVKGVPPWDIMWHDRYKIDSPIAQHLRDLREQPIRVSAGCDSGMSRDAAEKLKASNVADLKSKGVRLKSARPSSSYVTGGGLEKAIVSPDSDLYTSVRQASRDLGVSHGTIVRWIQRDRGKPDGWRFL